MSMNDTGLTYIPRKLTINVVWDKGERNVEAFIIYSCVNHLKHKKKTESNGNWVALKWDHKNTALFKIQTSALKT